MVQHILILTRHKKNFFGAQKSVIMEYHGQKTKIDFDSTRFSSNEELDEFHDEKSKKYGRIYYTLTVRQKLHLKDSGRSFGVILKPIKTRKSIQFKIVHHVPDQEKEIVVIDKTIPRNRGAKGYRNTPTIPNRKVA